MRSAFERCSKFQSANVGVNLRLRIRTYNLEHSSCCKNPTILLCLVSPIEFKISFELQFVINLLKHRPTFQLAREFEIPFGLEKYYNWELKFGWICTKHEHRTLTNYSLQIIWVGTRERNMNRYSKKIMERRVNFGVRH